MVFGKILLGTALVGGAVIMQDGVVSVNVREKNPGGHHIWFMAPGAIVPFGMKFVPAHHLKDHLRDTREWMPVARAALDALQKSPDGVFVEVDTPRKHVRIQKSWGRIVVDVDDPNEEVHVAVPVRLMRHTLSELEELQPAS
ncbi:MAG TPA: hypothetical protein VGR03_17415 [Candidatus Acidoferrum sp.]|nr:hypothetical protein [Candidatus Acidoferrum sp.]